MTFDYTLNKFSLVDASSDFIVDVGTDPAQFVMGGINGNALQTAYGVAFTHLSNTVTVDAVTGAVIVGDGVFSATMEKNLLTIADGVTANANLTPTTFDLTDASNNVNLNTATPSMLVSDGTNFSAVLAGSMTVTLPPTAADELTRKDYVDGFTTFRPSNMFYVAENGSDATGDGSYLNPWLTIQNAITNVEAVPPTAATQAVINVAPGHYTENLTFSNGYIHVISPFNSNDVNEVCEVIGNVTINIVSGTNDKFNKQVVFQGIQITGTINDTSTREHTVLIQDCYLFPANRALYQNSTVDCRTRILNTEINDSLNTGSTLAMLHISRGDCYMESVNLTYSNPGSVVLADVSGAVFATLCNFVTSSTSTAAPGIKIAYVTSSRTSTFGYCTFQFASGSTRTNANGFWCVRYEPPASSATNALSLGYCSFAALGMSGQSVAGSNGTQTPSFNAPIVYGACIAAPGGGTTVAGTATQQKVPFTVVV
jgi:hypothetical protein